MKLCPIHTHPLIVIQYTECVYTCPIHIYTVGTDTMNAIHKHTDTTPTQAIFQSWAPCAGMGPSILHILSVCLTWVSRERCPDKPP
jgi:hypothetical protein